MRKRSQARRVHTIEALESRLFLSTTTITADIADTYISNTGGIAWAGATNNRIGDNGTNVTEQVVVMPFQLPTLPVGAVISAVTASFNLEFSTNTPTGAIDVYGLGRRAALTLQGTDYFRGAYNTDSTDATAIQASLATGTTPSGILALNSTGQANLLSYFNTQYAGGAGAGQYVFLRLNHQQEQAISRHWTFSSANHATVANRPTITITYDVNTAPATPSNLTTATTGSNSVLLNWQDNSNNETGFRVQRSTSPTTGFSTVGTVGAGITTFTNNTGLSADTKYYYRVAATGSAGDSPYAPVASATTLPVFTNTRWVDVNYTGGTANGGYTTPYKTISAAMTAAASGDGLVLRGGTYREAVTLKAGVTLMGVPGERAVISGMENLTGWVVHSGSTYKTTLNWRPTSLFVGFDEKHVSTSPNTGWWYNPTVTQLTGITRITDATHLAGIPSLVGGAITAHVGSGNLWTSGTITAHNTSTGVIDVATNTTLDGMTSNDYYMIKNTVNLIDQPGEWAVADNGNGTWTVFFRPNNVADLNSTQARKMTGQQIRVSTGHNSTLRNVEVTGNTGFGINIGNTTAAPTTGVTVREVVVHNNGGVGVQSRYAANSTVRNSVVVANGGTGITMVSTHTGLVDRNEVAYNGNDGVVVAGDISGKNPGDTGWDPSDNITVSNNYIHDHNGYTHPDGIQIYRWPANVKILNNYITRASQAMHTEEVTGAEFSGNVVWDTVAYNVIFGHDNSTNWTVKNNTVGGAGSLFNISTGSTGYTFTENVFTKRFTIPSTSSGYVGNRNLFWGGGAEPLRTGTSTLYATIAAWNAATGQDANSLIGEPQFMNAPAYSYAMDTMATATTTSMQLTGITGLAVGDKIIINGDGVVRTVTNINTTTNTVTWDVALPMQPLTPWVTVDNWKNATNFAIDLRLKSTSPGYTLGATGGPVGSAVNTLNFAAGDFNNDGIRDIPLLDASIAAGLNTGNQWVPNSGI